MHVFRLFIVIIFVCFVLFSPSVTHGASNGDCQPPQGDGDVDIFDYNTLVGSFGSTSNLACDFTNPGSIDIFDYNLLVGNFGQTFPTSMPSLTPTPAGNTSTPTPMAMGENSHAMGLWTPRAKTANNLTYAGFDPQSNPLRDTTGQIKTIVKMAPYNGSILLDGCPSYPSNVTTEQQKLDYVKSIHDNYKVKGPDGKWYPTWHPPVDSATKCRFGHEHGRDPSQAVVWKQVKEYFYYDTNKNGVMDPSEEALSGLPFGYVNEQYDVYTASKGISSRRHEDHVGHKIEWANDEADIANTSDNIADNSGVKIGKLAGGDVGTDTGVKCYFLAKPHQGVSTKDAFTSNIHEVFYFADCRHSNTAYNTKISVAMMEGFGSVGGFTNFMPMCKIERRDDPQDLVCPYPNVKTNNSCPKDSVNQNYPPDNGDREIISRQCIEIGFLVPSGQWSGNLYEAWPASLEVVRPNGTDVLKGINLLFDVEDANRYYYPEDTKVQRGYFNHAVDQSTFNAMSTSERINLSTWNIGYTMDLCYDQSLSSQGRQERYGPCGYATDYGRIRDIKYDDPRSAFGGKHRGMYFQPAMLSNGSGPENWYTDPFGKNASTTPFPGAIKQQISAKNMNYSDLIGGVSIDPRVNDRNHDDGNGTVHAPN